MCHLFMAASDQSSMPHDCTHTCSSLPAASGFWELATGLTALRLSQYDTCIVRGLSQLQQLQHLRIEMMQRGREVKIEGVHRLAKLSCLEVIFPGATESAWLMNQDLSDFGKCTALTKLKMLGFSHVYQEHDELLRGLSSLRHLASLSIGWVCGRGCF